MPLTCRDFPEFSEVFEAMMGRTCRNTLIPYNRMFGNFVLILQSGFFLYFPCPLLPLSQLVRERLLTSKLEEAQRNIDFVLFEFEMIFKMV